MGVRFLGGLQVAARGLAFPFRSASVGGDVAEALGDREFVDFGGALVGALSAFGGALDVFLRDGLPRGEFRPPPQLLGPLGGLLTW